MVSSFMQNYIKNYFHVFHISKSSVSSLSVTSCLLIACCSHTCIIPGLILGCFTHVHLSLEYFSLDGFTRVNLISFRFLSPFQACFSDIISNSPFSSVHFSHSVMSKSLRPHEPQHARPPCPSPTPGVYPNSCPLSRWCHPNISSSVIPFSSRPQSFPHQGLFKWVSSLHLAVKVLEFQLQHQSFQWTPRADLL